MLDKLKNMFEAQKKLNEIKLEMETINVDNETANGLVKISMSGTQKLSSVDINIELLQPDKKEILQAMLLECINGAAEKVQRAASQKLKSKLGNLKMTGL